MDKGDLFCLGLYFIVGSILCLIVSFNFISDEPNEPTAMDVYQGKTTLEYVVVDGQVTDSTVIWKKDIQ
jgi:hypothetical protein